MRIYLITNTANGKIYVGKTQQTIALRWKSHCKCARTGIKTHLYEAMRKYGVDAFVIQELVEASSKEQLDALEISLIALLLSTNPSIGYNMTMGGDGGRHSAETRARITASLLGRRLSIEHRAAISEAGKGRTMSPRSKEALRAANKGRVRRTGWHHSEEAKQRIAKSAIGNERFLGKTHSEDTKRKMSESQAGHAVSLDTRLKISEAKKGKKLSVEHRAKISAAGFRRYSHQTPK